MLPVNFRPINYGFPSDVLIEDKARMSSPSDKERIILETLSSLPEIFNVEFQKKSMGVLILKCLLTNGIGF